MPQGIAADEFGNAYVAGLISCNAFKITPGGVITEIIDETGDGAGLPFDDPRSITVDGSGHVYVTAAVPPVTEGVFKITPGGIITLIIDGTGDSAANTLDYPWGVAVDGSGNVYVAGHLSDNALQQPRLAPLRYTALRPIASPFHQSIHLAHHEFHERGRVHVHQRH